MEYWHWILIGILLSGLEMFVTSFFLIWMGISAIAVGLLMMAIPISFAWQLIAWSILSFSCLVAWFKFVSPKMKDKTKSGMAMEAMQGKIGTVLECHESRGKIRFPAPVLGEDEWPFICKLPDADIKPGDKVIVTETSGNDLIVKPKNEST